MQVNLTPTLVALAAALGIGWLVAGSDDIAPTGGSRTVNGIPLVEHVIYLSIDGLRGDTLDHIIATRPDEFPHFARLKNGGASTFRARTDFSFTATIPNHCSMVTGRPVYEPGTTDQSGIIGHGQVNNTGAAVTGLTSVIHRLGGNGSSYAYKSSVFDVVHESGRPTAFFFSKDRLSFLVRSYDATNGADSTGVSGVIDPSRNKIDRSSPADNLPAGATATGDAFVADADTHGLAAFTMLHFIDPDTSVHATAVTTTAPPAPLSSYETAIKNCDIGLGKVFAWLDAHPLEQSCTTLIVSGDHGGVGGNQAHRDETQVENYTIPFFIHGPGFRAASDSYHYFANRSDPGTARPTDLLGNLPNPPLRNGDMANLATTLLGLPPVPGSYFTPIVLDPDTTTLLSIDASDDGVIEIAWPLSATSYRLETATQLQDADWSPVSSDLSSTAESNVHTAAPGIPAAFFRLRKTPVSM